MEPRFTINSLVQFGKENWRVVSYIKENGVWNISFQLGNSKKRKLVPIEELEKFV